MTISGDYFNGVSSRRFDAELAVGDNGAISVSLAGTDPEPAPAPAGLEELTISSRLHDVPRSIRFPGGQQFMTADNDGVDRLLEAAGSGQIRTLAHRLESHIPFVVISWLGVVVFAISFLQWGVPAIAARAAALVPEATEFAIGVEMMDEIDRRHLCVPTGLDVTRRVEIDRYLNANEARGFARIEFRECPAFGANAFALPGGLILLTDDLVELSQRREQLLAVYFHEMGHVTGRHLVKQGLQSSMISLFIMAMTGDLTAATDLATTIPATLLTFSYSRDFEREADAYAIRRLREARVDPEALAEILKQLAASQEKKGSGFTGPRYLSTHPGTEERLQMIERARTDGR